ncbi:MAG: hypothetical protein QNJ94_08115 [Alphaproteobacteria bacterium]|nr:hypothetical protein [Alphaproteobacteria bacterium]
MTVDRETIEQIAEAAAEKGGRKAASEVLRGLGVDVDNPLDAQADMRHLRRHRETCETVQRHGMRVVITVIVTSAAAAILAFFGFKSGMGR